MQEKPTKYIVKDPLLNIHFKIIDGVRYWITVPPVNYEK
jgi:hypothetical protein|tara:strand:+ start:427 stop:543 length:117 start_codon:yes stop_codon:yes gene_type:complete